MYEFLVRDTPSSASARPHGVRVPEADPHVGVIATDLGKRFDDRWALRHLDLDVPPGRVLGLLGHAGAGKTTAIRTLTTLSQPTEGRATVAGHNVATAAPLVRASIGVASQQATVDGLLDARLNLEMIGRLHGLPKERSRRRADELLERFGLSDTGGRLVGKFSGGMRRRLDLAACLVATPTVLLLDEPTTGLDPHSREALGQMLRDLVDDGTTVILATHDLDEADRLADDIVVLDHGRTIAHGTPAQLRAQIGDDRVELVVATDQLGVTAAVLSSCASGGVAIDRDRRTVTASTDGTIGVMTLLRALDDAGVEVDDVNRRQPTLDDVFVSLTWGDLG